MHRSVVGGISVVAAALMPTAGNAGPASVSGGGVTLTSVSVEWPDTDRPFPDGPGVDAVNSNCTACHSPNMILTQPKLTQAGWQETVTKMRKVYKAPVDDAAVPAIVGYLVHLQAK